MPPRRRHILCGLTSRICFQCLCFRFYGLDGGEQIGAAACCILCRSLLLGERNCEDPRALAFAREVVGKSPDGQGAFALPPEEDRRARDHGTGEADWIIQSARGGTGEFGERAA